MSDEEGAARHRDSNLYVHYREHPGCTKWDAVGFAHGKTEQNWFCFGHRLDWKARHA